MITATIDAKQLRSKLQRLDSGITRAVRNTINKTISSAHSRAAKLIGAELAVKPSKTTPAQYIKGKLEYSKQIRGLLLRRTTSA